MQRVGVERNTQMAVKFLEEFAKAGSWGIIPLLVKCYDEGYGVKENMIETVRSY